MYFYKYEFLNVLIYVWYSFLVGLSVYSWFSYSYTIIYLLL